MLIACGLTLGYRDGNHGPHPMLRRLLNVASVICLIACLALMGMWVRSYHRWDNLNGRLTDSHAFDVHLTEGRVLLDWVPLDWVPFVAHPWDSRVYNWRWAVYSDSIGDGTEILFHLNFALRGTPAPLGFSMDFSRAGSTMMLPYWFLVLTSESLAAAFRMRWPLQFNLRSLFIATTFLAVVLGMMAWLDRAWIGK
jgi:hypothetical protein